MSDYRIIVEVNKRGGAKSSATIPDSSSTDKPTRARKSRKASSDPTLSSVISAARNPAGALTKLALGTGVGAGVLLAARTAMTIAENVIDINSSLSGDYSTQMAFNNFKAGVNFITNPLSSTIGIYKRQATIEKTNRKQAAQRELMGNADLGGDDRRGG